MHFRRRKLLDLSCLYISFFSPARISFLLFFPKQEVFWLFFYQKKPIWVFFLIPVPLLVSDTIPPTEPFTTVLKGAYCDPSTPQYHAILDRLPAQIYSLYYLSILPCHRSLVGSFFFSFIRFIFCFSLNRITRSRMKYT